MRSLILSLLLGLATTVALVASPTQAWAASDSAVKSYREWKTSKIQDAEARFEAVRLRVEGRKTDPNLARSTPGPEGRNAESMRLEAQLHSERMALDIAKELSVSDYFAGYLTKQADKKSAFKEVAGKLSADEVAELMTAYANSVFGAESGRIAPSAQNFGRDGLK